MKYFKFPFLVLFLLTLIHCAGVSDSEVTIPGVMMLSTEPTVGGAPVKFGVPPEAELVEFDTEMTVKTQESADTVFLEILGFFGEGNFTTEGPVRVMLDPEAENSGMVFKLDENDQPLGKHQINLNFIVEINDQQLKMGGVQVGGFTAELELEVEVAPIEYRNGSDETSLLKMPGLKKFTNVVLKRGLTGDLDFPIEVPNEN